MGDRPHLEVESVPCLHPRLLQRVASLAKWNSPQEELLPSRRDLNRLIHLRVQRAVHILG